MTMTRSEHARYLMKHPTVTKHPRMVEALAYYLAKWEAKESHVNGSMLDEEIYFAQKEVDMSNGVRCWADD